MKAAYLNFKKNINGEKWEAIAGFDDLYSISNIGRVKSIKTNKIKSQHFCRGYLYVDLYKGNVRTKKKVHRLVAEAFIPNPENKPEVNHKRGIKTDNYACSLEWATRQENVRHSFKTGLQKPVMLGLKGELCHNSKPVNQYTKNGEFIKRHTSMTEAQKEINVLGIYHSVSGKRKYFGGFKWEYA